MQTLQEQDQDCTNPYSLRRKALIPGASVNEYRGTNVYKPVGSDYKVKEMIIPVEGDLMGGYRK